MAIVADPSGKLYREILVLRVMVGGSTSWRIGIGTRREHGARVGSTLRQFG